VNGIHLHYRAIPCELEPLLGSLKIAAFRLSVVWCFMHGFWAFDYARADVVQVELHSFETRTLSDQQFLSGSKEGDRHVIAGELRLPAGERPPVVVLIHGSGGVSGYVHDWADELNRAGVATFMLDSFTGRGLGNIVNEPEKLGRLAMIFDAYRALEILAEHPQVDPAKIAVMGFSRGGQAALYASLNRFRRLHGPERGSGFAAHIAFYPDCSTSYLEEDDVTHAPIRVLHGTADDFNPLRPCQAYIERLRSGGADAVLLPFDGAAHVFDWPLLQKPLIFEKAPVTRDCRLQEGEGGVVNSEETGRPFSYVDSCVRFGATLHYDAEAHDSSRKAVIEILQEAFADD
jgi:dienelactone hydrolase